MRQPDHQVSRQQRLPQELLLAYGGCGCPLEVCCDGERCVDGAECRTFPDDDPSRFATFFDAPTERPAQVCVLLPAANETCGAADAPCCYADGATSIGNGTCDEDAYPDRQSYCLATSRFGLISGPLCQPGGLKLSGDPDCGEPEDDGSPTPCCLDESCPGNRVCRPQPESRAPTPYPLSDTLLCYDCQVADGACGAATPNDVQCCADLEVFGPGKHPTKILRSARLGLAPQPMPGTP